MMEERLNRTPEEETENAQEEAQSRLEQETAEEKKLGEAQQPEEAQAETEEEREERERLMEVAELAARLTLMHRQAWEEEAGEDLILARELRRLHEGESVQEILAQLNEARDRQAAERLNMNPEELMALRERLMRRREQQDARHRFAQTLIAQEEVMRRVKPDFDLTECIRRSPAFRALILAGEPVERAVAYLDPEAGRRLAEQEVAQRMRRRASRPRTLSAPGPSRRQVTVDTMSEAELRRIDEKLKRGEHVRLN